MKKYLNARHIIERLRSQKNPVKFLLSRILWQSKLCRFFTINLSHGVKVRFYPTSVSTALWTDSKSFDSDGINFIWDYLKEGDIFIDAGANIGQFTLTGAQKAGKILSIEPHPRIFSFLKSNIKLNGFDNVKTHNVALGDKNGVLYFSDVRSDDQNFIKEGGGIKVEVKKLDDLVSCNKIDLLKIDVEGYELFVLKGALEILPKVEAVLFENFKNNFDRYGYQLRDVLDLLESNNFKIFKFCDGNKLEQVNTNYFSDKCENLLAVKDVNFLEGRLKDFKLI